VSKMPMLAYDEVVRDRHGRQVSHPAAVMAMDAAPRPRGARDDELDESIKEMLSELSPEAARRFLAKVQEYVDGLDDAPTGDKPDPIGGLGEDRRLAMDRARTRQGRAASDFARRFPGAARIERW
jgi:hypothetical protein